MQYIPNNNVARSRSKRIIEDNTAAPVELLDTENVISHRSAWPGRKHLLQPPSEYEEYPRCSLSASQTAQPRLPPSALIWYRPRRRQTTVVGKPQRSVVYVVDRPDLIPAPIPRSSFSPPQRGSRDRHGQRPAIFPRAPSALFLPPCRSGMPPMPLVLFHPFIACSIPRHHRSPTLQPLSLQCTD